MYKQSIQNIKAVIIPLDGTILDLNRLRFNYYNHLCQSKNVTLTKQDFYNHLSSMYDMYNGLPLSEKYDLGPLNAKIERELLQYLKYKGVTPKEGVYELIEYLHQKNIQIAIISTHRTKDTVAYLKLAKLYEKVDFIIGSDTSSLPLPSPHILKTVTEFFNVLYEDMLVISSFPSLTQAAYRLHMNIIYCQDLLEPDQEAIQCSYKTATNLFDVLNILLFDQYEEVEMYSPILGMNDHMSLDELHAAYQKAKNTYQDDKQLLDLIEKNYLYHLNQSQDNHSLSHKKQTSQTNNQYFSFDDEDEIEENDEVLIEDKTSNHDISQNDTHIHVLNADEEDELANLLNQISKKDITFPIEDHQINTFDESEHEDFQFLEKKTYKISTLFVNIFYILAISFLILFTGLIIYVALIQHFRANTGLFYFLNQVFIFYNNMVTCLFHNILNGLHAIMDFIPSYEQYIKQMTAFSLEGLQLFHIYIFQCLMIALIKGIYAIIKKGERHVKHNQRD